jgi:uncharacterized membrane protein
MRHPNTSFVIAVTAISSCGLCAFGQPSFEGLGSLPGGDFDSAAYAITGDESVVVGVSDSDAGWQACRWSDGEITGLGDLPGGTSTVRDGRSPKTG